MEFVNWNADSGGALLSSFFTPPPSRPGSPRPELPAWCAREQREETERRKKAASDAKTAAVCTARLQDEARLAREGAREPEKRKRREKKAAWLHALAVWPDEDAEK